MKIMYVTGNWAKFKSAKLILEPIGIEVEQIKMDTTEIQADTFEEVAGYSAKEACNKLNMPVLKNDSGLCIESLGGFPGPYTRYIDEKLGEDGILKLLEGKENRKACFIEAFAYCEPGKEPVVFKSITNGTIAKEKSGTYGWSWDFIFIPEGQTKTLGNYKDEERLLMWNKEGYNKLANYLKNELNVGK